MIEIPAATITQFWVFLQIMVRISSLVVIAPVFSARQIPAQVKVGLTVILSIALTPILASTIAKNGALPTDLYGLVSTLVLQAMIGLVLGFAVSMIFMAFQMAGALIDIQIGFTMAQTLNPAFNDLESPLTQFLYYYVLLLFQLANGHHILLMAVARSFALLPASALNLTSGGYLQMVSDITFGALVSGIKIAAPVLAVLTVLDVSFALMSRAMPQLNVFFVGMPAKVAAGLVVLGVALPAMALFAGQLVSGEPRMLSDLLHSMHRA